MVHCQGVCSHHALQHAWENEAVEHDIVLAYEVNEARLWVLPPLLPSSEALWLTVAEFLGVRYVADRCVEPHVEYLSLGSLYRNGDAPVEVAGHGAWLKVHVQPTLTLPIYVRTPFLVSVENPLFQPFLIVVQWQIPVLGFPDDGLRTRDG